MYCRYCGQLMSNVWTGYYNTSTGEKELVKECINNNCIVGKQNVCGKTGHSFGFFGVSCKKCGYTPVDLGGIL